MDDMEEHLQQSMAFTALSKAYRIGVTNIHQALLALRDKSTTYRRSVVIHPQNDAEIDSFVRIETETGDALEIRCADLTKLVIDLAKFESCNFERVKDVLRAAEKGDNDDEG